MRPAVGAVQFRMLRSSDVLRASGNCELRAPTAAKSIQSFRFEPDQWLWCEHCERFFEGRDARPDFLAGIQACAFEECDGAGPHNREFETEERADVDTVRVSWW